MGEIKLWQAAFNGGEATALLEGREDLQKYPNMCRRLRNYHGIIQGPARRRSGSRRVAPVKSNGEAWLLPFIKGRRVAYQIELGDNYARFYKMRGQLESSPGVPYEIATPWTYADLTDADGTFKFRVVQSNDVIFVCGGNGIKQINRFGDVDWTITDFETVGGPFDGPNITDTTIVASAQTGTVTLTASLPIFTSDRIGSLILLRPQNLSSVKPWEPNTIIATDALRRSDGKTYKNLTAGVTEGTNGQTHAGTVSPIHEEGIASDGGTGGKIYDTNDSTDPARVTTGYDWEFQDPGYGIAKITAVSTGQGGIDGFTRFVLHFDGSDASTTITDAAGLTTWSASGNAQLDTAQQQFGTASLLTDGTGDYVSSATGGTELTNQNFTIDGWFRANHAGSGALRGIIGKMTNFTAATHSYGVLINGSNLVELSISNGTTRTTLAGTTQFNNSTNVGWHHFAAVRSGNTLMLFIDGILENQTTFSGTVPTLAESILVGALTEANDFFTGWIDELRLSVGVARWTSNFTPPAAPYDNAGASATAVVQPWRIGANAQLPEHVTGANTTTRWAWGLFSNAAGWPKAPTFFRERFVLATSRKIAFSVPSSYSEFVMETAGQILADNAFVADIQSDRDEELQWLMPASVLHVGTTGAEHVIQEMTQQQVFGPENRKIDPHTGYGSNGVAPIRVGDTPLFVDASGLRVRAVELGENGRFTALSQNDLAEHITASTVIQTAFAALPDSLYWGMRQDGRLACLTFSKEQDVFGWSLHLIGGFRDMSKLQSARVRSVSSIPSPDGTLDDVWMIVERYVNGAIQRQVEFFTEALAPPQMWEGETKEAFKRRLLDFQADQFFVDGGVSLDNPISISDIDVVSGTVTITSNAHGLSNGDLIRIDEIMGMWQLNARSFEIENVTTNTFDLVDVDGSDFTAYASGGVFRELVTNITNLSPYEGQTVQVLTDGAVHPERVVTGGEIDLQYPAGRVHIGYGYRSLIETQRPSGGAEEGSAQGQLGAINQIIVRFLNSLGGKIGPNEDLLDDIEFRQATDLMDLPPPLFSGDKEQGWPDGFSTDRTVVFVQDQPLPSIIEGFGLNMEVNQ